MKKFIVCGLLSFSFSLFFVDLFSIKTINQELVTTIYDRGLHVSQTQQKKIEDLLNDITASTPCQLYATVILLIPQLQTLIEKNIQSQKNRIMNFIVHNQIEHLKKYKKTLASKLNFFECLELRFEKIFKKLSSYLKKADVASKKSGWEESLADRIFDYCNFERENILINYENLLNFIVYTKANKLPDIINFWSNRELQGKLAHQVRSITPEVTVQFLAELFMLALQSFLMAGNGMYIQWLDEEDGKIFEEYQKKQGEIETNFEVYVKHLDAVKKNMVNQIITGFKNGLQKIYDERKDANDTLAKEQVYLFKSINLSSPVIHTLSWPPVPYDQMFEAGIMNTPKHHQWYNIYQQGDWEFYPKTNSFFQNELVLFGTPFWQKDFKTLQKPGQSKDENITDPSRNSIFTEYISNDASYAISIECTLLNCSYPFFVGVMFNKGRWISGDPERLWQYRLIGLYGTQAQENDPLTRSISLGFAQQIITTENKKEKIISPLEQIVMARPNDENILFYTLPKKDTDLLAKDSITFVFDITTSPETVSIVVSKKGKEQLIQKTFNNVGSTIALFGGIGFMAAGAQAEFKIIKPEKLVFSSTDLEDKQ